jgi:hypothetical protein
MKDCWGVDSEGKQIQGSSLGSYVCVSSGRVPALQGWGLKFKNPVLPKKNLKIKAKSLKRKVFYFCSMWLRAVQGLQRQKVSRLSFYPISTSVNSLTTEDNYHENSMKLKTLS